MRTGPSATDKNTAEKTACRSAQHSFIYHSPNVDTHKYLSGAAHDAGGCERILHTVHQRDSKTCIALWNAWVPSCAHIRLSRGIS